MPTPTEELDAIEAQWTTRTGHLDVTECALAHQHLRRALTLAREAIERETLCEDENTAYEGAVKEVQAERDQWRAHADALAKAVYELVDDPWEGPGHRRGCECKGCKLGVPALAVYNRAVSDEKGADK